MQYIRQIVIALVLLVAVTAPALADCRINGVSYPTGAVVGGLVCTANGTWQRR